MPWSNFGSLGKGKPVKKEEDKDRQEATTVQKTLVSGSRGFTRVFRARGRTLQKEGK